MTMLSEKLQDAFNDQIRNEYQAHYIYLSMAAYLETEGWPGLSAWMRGQAEEEREHAMRFFDHVTERNGHVQLGALEAPPHTWDGPVAVFEAALEHERKVTEQIRGIFDLVRTEEAYDSESLLQWFAEEQVEEERTVGDILDHIRRLQGDEAALLKLDDELGSREG